MIVYRIALPPTHDGNSTGRWIGPYREGSQSYDDKVRALAHKMNNEHCNDTHPSPWTDVPGGINPDEFCVFSDAERVNDWFEFFGMDLEEAGYMVVSYDVPEENVRKGRYQDVAVVTDENIVAVDSPMGFIH